MLTIVMFMLMLVGTIAVSLVTGVVAYTLVALVLGEPFLVCCLPAFF